MAQSTPVPDGSKRCTKCDEVKPLDEFHRDKSRLDGRQTRCKACKVAYQAAERERRAEYNARYRAQNADAIAAQRARSRDENREATSARRAKYRAENRDRIAAQSAAHYRRNRDRIIAKAAAYRAANPDKVREMGARRYRENRDRVCEQHAEYYAANSERIRAAAAAWRAANRHKVTAYSAARRARLREGDSDPLVNAQSLRERDGDRCCYCQAPMRFCGDPNALDRANVEHITPVHRGGSHTFDNTALACRACNVHKGARLFIWEWTPPFPTSAT